MTARTLSDRPGTSVACGTSVQDEAGRVGKEVVVLGSIVSTDCSGKTETEWGEGKVRSVLHGILEGDF